MLQCKNPGFLERLRYQIRAEEGFLLFGRFLTVAQQIRRIEVVTLPNRLLDEAFER